MQDLVAQGTFRKFATKFRLRALLWVSGYPVAFKNDKFQLRNLSTYPSI